MKFLKKYNLHAEIYYNSTWEFNIRIVLAADQEGLEEYMKDNGIDVGEIDFSKLQGMVWFSESLGEYIMFLMAQGLHMGVVVHESCHVMQLVLMDSRFYDQREDPNEKLNQTLEAEAYLISVIFAEVWGRVRHLINKKISHITVLQSIKN